MIKKTINFDEEIIEKVEKMAEESERDFSSQVRWIIKEFIKLKESK